MRAGNTYVESSHDRKEAFMFNGLTRSLAIVTALMVALPALMIWAAEGSDWARKFGQMSPFF
jgi:hypothetical protein